MDKYVFGVFVIAIVAILQGVAWLLNKNGGMFALTSSIITGIGVFLIQKKAQKPPSDVETPTK